MIENYNNIVNKYVDNELNKQEIDNVNDFLDKDEEFRNTLSVHKYVHESLYDIPLKLAPNGFTESIMNKIVRRISDKYKKNYFFRAIMAFLSLFFIGVLFLFFYFLGSLEIVQSASSSANTYTDKIIPTLTYFTDFVKTDIFKTVTGLISFIVLVAFYFNLNSHKEMKNRLKEL